MNRRTVLRGSVALVPLVTAGCAGFRTGPTGVNETVTFESEYPEDLTLEVVVSRHDLRVQRRGSVHDAPDP